jgi:hypothetical protein
MNAPLNVHLVPVDLSLISLDDGAQMRIKLSETTVDDYADAMNDGAEFPPIIVFHDGEKYWIADGFHRHAAHVKLGRTFIIAEVRRGGLRDAIQHSLGANETHGLRRTRADKRRAVETALADPEWAKLSDRDIAKMCVVSHTLVSQVRSGPVIVATKAQTVRTTGNIATKLGPVGLAITDVTTGNIATAPDALIEAIWRLIDIADDDQIADALSELNRVAKRRGII